MRSKPRIGIFKLSSCDGCQSMFFDIPWVWEHFDVVFWLLGRGENDFRDIDIAFVEGSVSTPQEEELIREIREQSKLLVTIGACATSGGIQALRNFGGFGEYVSLYPKPELLDISDTSTPVSEHVDVNYELYGCPINALLLENFLKSYLFNKRPSIPDYPLCMECKLRGNVCVMDAYNIPCLGPVVRAGCGALCPSVKRGCYGCFGPCKNPNTHSLVEWFRKMGLSEREVKELFMNENVYAPEFREVIEGYEGD